MEASERKPDDELRQAKIRLLEAKGALIAAQMERLLDDQQPKANHLKTEPARSPGPDKPRLKIEIEETPKGPMVSSWHGRKPDSFFRRAISNDDLFRQVHTVVREWLEAYEKTRTP